METVFDKNPGQRSDAEWRRMLGDLMESLSIHTGIRFSPVSWFIEDHPGYASSRGCVDIRGSINPALRLAACGVLGISVNHGESCGASADILLFSGGRRVLGPDSREVVRFQYTPDGWAYHGWMYGEMDEWACSTDAHWSQTEPDAEAGPGDI